MKRLSILFVILAAAAAAFAQNEQAPIIDGNFAYKDWTLRNLNGEGETNLREFVKGKKFVMVVYWAPWCPNWAHDVEFVRELHEKYADNGLSIIGVGQYDSVRKMREHFEQKKLTFPSVYESDKQADREKTIHFAQRREAGDMRKWGTPWYVFIDPASVMPDGDVLVTRPKIINGEMIKPEAEKFIRQKLGLETGSELLSARSELVEACDPATAGPKLQKP